MGISDAVGLTAVEAHLSAVYCEPGMPLIDHIRRIMDVGCM